MSAPLYLVPHDFTPIADNALDHALNLAKTRGVPVNIMLLHVVRKEADAAPARAKLKDHIAKRNITQEGVSIEGRVFVGSIFEDIGKIAGFAEATMIVMGTHGPKGWQKVVGSHALRVITYSHVPFLVVQQDPPTGEFSNIVLPLLLEKESLRILKWAESLAKRYSSTIHLVGRKETDEWLDHKIKANIELSRRQLKAHNIDFTVNLLEGGDNFQDEVIEFGRKVGASVFALAYVPENTLPMFDRFAQAIITNPDQLPVLIVNPN